MSDILNPTFLMCLGIILISIACLVIYFENKLREQNHKMSSMLGLITSLTDEVNHTKKFLLHVTNNIPFNPNVPLHKTVELNDEQQLLIPVSDDDDGDDDDDSDSESESESDDEDDDDDDKDDIVSLTPTVYDINKTKILKIDITPQNFTNTLYTENVENDNLEELNLISESDSDSESESESESGSNVDTSNESKLQNHAIPELNNVIDDIITTELKTIDITHLDDLAIVDYKKLSVPKLKILVGEKGLAADCSKMKKNDLLKLLEMS